MKHIIWDHLSIALKKVRNFLVEVEDERELANTCLTNVSIIQENMGEKSLKDFTAINYLNSRSKAQLIFVGIQDKVELISQAMKYIIKDRMMKDIISKANFMLGSVVEFILLFKELIQQGLPSLWDEQGTRFMYFRK